MSALRGIILALVAACLGACSPGRPQEDGVFLSWEEIRERPPAMELPGPVRIWAVERAPDMGVYYVLSRAPRVGSTRQGRSALRVVLLRGRARLRLGEAVKESGSWAYAAVPSGMDWSLERLGDEPVVLSVLASPDVAALSDLLRPVAPEP